MMLAHLLSMRSRPQRPRRRTLARGTLARGTLLLLAFAGTVLNASAQVLGVAAPARSQRFLEGRTQPHAATSLVQARQEHLRLAAQPRAANLAATWTSVGPDQVLNPIYGAVTGRITALLIDPADPTGNTLFVGTTGGGVWKSINAAGPAAAVTFTPLTDTLPVFDLGLQSSAVPSLSIGALAKAGSALLAGTGDPNDATDSYYGGGILRSVDGGLTWTLTSGSNDGASGHHTFQGLAVAGMAASSTDPGLVVAALTQSAASAAVGAIAPTEALPGLYVSADGGATWRFGIVYDAPQVGDPTGPDVVQWVDAGPNDTLATSVVWNPLRQRFYAAIRHHGYYQSADGTNWTRLPVQPGAGITPAACPTIARGTSTCPLERGVLAVEPATGDLFAWTVDQAQNDLGLFQDLCSATSGGCANSAVAFAQPVNAAPLEAGSGSHEILQGDYNLALLAVPNGADTLLFAGAIDLYRCSLGSGCVLRNTTNAQNGCATPAGVAGAQHAIAASGSLLFLGNDGGLWRSTDGVAETGSPCSASDAAHFQNLNGSLGSLAEVVGLAEDPLLPATLLGGFGALGSAGTDGSAGGWHQMSTGEGGVVSIDPAQPQNWYIANGAGLTIARCTHGSACGLSDFAATAIGAPQVANDYAAIHAAWLLDPEAANQLIAGTCRVWRGPATGDSGWTPSNTLSPPFAAATGNACPANAPAVTALAAGGPANADKPSPNLGSTALYAASFGHVFSTSNASLASGNTPWTDLARSPVTNAPQDNHLFNPAGYSISAVAVDPHDVTGRTVYATVQGFAGSSVYRSTDAGASWLAIAANLPRAPANGVLVDPNNAEIVYVALDTGVYVTTSVSQCANLACWSVYGAGLPNAPVTQLVAAIGMTTGDGRRGELRAGTYGRGIWQIPLVSAVAPAAPAMTLTPASLSFGSQQVATQSAAQTITVTNSGNAPLSVTSVVASDGFAASSTCSAAPIAPAATCTVAVRFAPASTGPVAGKLTVFGDTAAGQAGAALDGTGTAPAAIVLTPGSLSFPSTAIGSTAPAQNITVANTGGNSAALQSVAVAGDFRISANTCQSALAPQTGCTVSLVFVPTASGTRSGTLTVADDAGIQVAQLTGTGAAPATDALTPLALSFQPQQPGTASAAQQVMLTNAGDQDLTLIHVVASGEFTAVDHCGPTLPGHSTCAIAVTYTPVSVGAVTGTLIVSDELRTQTVALSGTGQAGPGVSLAPVGGLSFPATAVGQQAAAQTVTLSNNGGLPLALASVAVTGDFAPGSNTCGSLLGPGSSCVIEILFLPTSGGPRTGSLTLKDNAANAPQSLPLTGTGIDFSLTPDGPASVAVASGQTATYLLLLASPAGVPGAAAFTCSGAPTAAFCTVTPGSEPLGAASPAVVTVTIATGQAHAHLAIPQSPWSLRPDQALWLALLLPAAGFARRRPRSSRSCLPLAALSLVCLALGGCGVSRTIPSSGSGGGSGPPAPITPAGSYAIVVTGTATGMGGGLVRTANLTLVIQ